MYIFMSTIKYNEGALFLSLTLAPARLRRTVRGFAAAMYRLVQGRGAYLGEAADSIGGASLLRYFLSLTLSVIFGLYLNIFFAFAMFATLNMISPDA